LNNDVTATDNRIKGISKSIDNRSSALDYGHSLNRDNRQRTYARIAADNALIQERLDRQQGTYDVRQWEGELGGPRGMTRLPYLAPGRGNNNNNTGGGGGGRKQRRQQKKRAPRRGVTTTTSTNMLRELFAAAPPRATGTSIRIFDDGVVISGQYVHLVANEHYRGQPGHRIDLCTYNPANNLEFVLSLPFADLQWNMRSVPALFLLPHRTRLVLQVVPYVSFGKCTRIML
jgi:hypothetical protein